MQASEQTGRKEDCKWRKPISRMTKLMKDVYYSDDENEYEQSKLNRQRDRQMGDTKQ